MDREALGDRPLGKYDVFVSITKFEPAELIEWDISTAQYPSIGHVYGYELGVKDGGTLVTSYCDPQTRSPLLPKWKSFFPVVRRRPCARRSASSSEL